MDERTDLRDLAQRRDEDVDLDLAGPGDPRYDDMGTTVPPAERGTTETPEGQDPDEIRDDIEDTRTQMSQTVDAIQERLDPQRLKDQAMESAQSLKDQAIDSARDATIGKAERAVSSASDTAKETGSGIVETIKQNPIPAALIAVGAGWLWMNRTSASSSRRGMDYSRPYYSASYRGDYPRGYPMDRYGANWQPESSSGSGRATEQAQETMSRTASRAQDQAGQMMSQAQDQVGQLTDQAQQQVGQWTNQAQDQMHSLSNQLDTLLHENPLAVAAVALGIGAAVGLAVPETPQENQWMGQARDTVMDKAQDAAQDTMQKMQQVASKAQDAAQQEAQQQGLTSGD